jgi:hypothetical protein
MSQPFSSSEEYKFTITVHVWSHCQLIAIKILGQIYSKIKSDTDIVV